MSAIRTVRLVLVAAMLSVVSSRTAQTLGTASGHAARQGDAERWAAETLKTLTLAQKVGQLIVPDIRGEYISDDDDRFQKWVQLARDYGVGGFCVYGGTPHETASLLNRLQKAARLPLLMSTDFEGGPGQQFIGASEFPGNMALSAIGSESLAYEEGKVGAREGRAIGIHLTYSPVVDIQTNPANPVLSVRSFGADPDLVGRLAAAYIKGYQENGMLATAKHFPGRGDVELIPGTEFTINRKPADQVEREDFTPFKKAIDAGVRFVMSEHIVIPSLTPGSDLPASVDKTLATTWLREKLGFTGILTSDDLWYKKMVDRFGAERTGILSIQAGHDVLLKPADPIKMIEAVAAAVRSGEIPEARVDQSVLRVLTVKASLNLHRSRFVDPSRIDSLVGTREHKALIRRIAEESITVLANDGFLPSSASRVGKIVHISYQGNESDLAPVAVATRLQDAFQTTATFFLRTTSDPAQVAKAVTAGGQADTVIVSLFNQRVTYKDNGPLPDAIRAMIADLVRAKPHATVVMSYGNPYLIAGLEAPGTFVVGYGEGGFYGNQLVFADAFIKLLRGEIAPRGKLPIKVSDRYPVGSGIVMAPRSAP